MRNRLTSACLGWYGACHTVVTSRHLATLFGGAWVAFGVLIDFLDSSLIHPRYLPETYNHPLSLSPFPLIQTKSSSTAPRQTQHKSHFIDNQQFPPDPKMYSCANQPRGCRGRVNSQGAKCKDCSVRCRTMLLCIPVSGLTFSQMYNYRKPSSHTSVFSQPVNYRRPSQHELQPDVIQVELGSTA
jgi:hypothetical protein